MVKLDIDILLTFIEDIRKPTILYLKKSGMSSNNQDINYELLLTELNTSFLKSISDGLKSEIAPYLNFSSSYIERSKECETNCAKSIDNNALQAYLNENSKYCDVIFDLLDNAIHKKPTAAFIEVMGTLDDKAFQMLEVIPENNAFTEKITTIFSVPVPKYKLARYFKYKVAPFIKSLILPKRNDKEDEPSINRLRNYPNRSFFFHYLVIENFEKLNEKYSGLYENILALLLFLWQLDIERQKKFEELSKEEYVLDAKTNHTLSAEDITKAEQLNKSVLDSHEAIISELKTYAEKLIHDFIDGNGIKAEDPKFNIRIDREFKQLISTYSKIQDNWNNTAFILSEDWKLELEIHSLKFTMLKYYIDFSKSVDTNFSLPVEENLSVINNSVAELKSMLASVTEENRDKFTEQLGKAKAAIKRKLVIKLLPALRDILLKANIPNLIEDLESSSVEEFNKISKKRFLVKKIEYNQPISSSEFDFISPNDMLAYEILPKFKGTFPNLKTGFIQHFQTFQNLVSEVSEIIDFAIESSVSFFEQEQNLKEALKISTDGIDRAEKKLKDISELHNSFLENTVEKLGESLEGFVQEILVITDNENAFQIKVKVARLKAIERSKAMKEKVLLKIRNLLPVILEYINKLFAFLRTSTDRFSKQFLKETSKHFIASDTSDYLAETEKSINKLPYVYQRLFKIEPLSSFELYVERKQPMDEMTNAYKKWKTGKFAPVIVVGEKGSGKTSFINRFIKAHTQNEKVVVLDLHLEQGTPESLYSTILKERTVAQSLKSENPDEKKSIVIVDGLERLFTSEINGFEYLLKTMQLISDTNTTIFWIVSCHIYSWYYIDKTYSISDYFGYHIKLNDLTPENLKEIIEKRHNISGYNLVFEPGQEKKAIMSFKKVTEEDKQSVIKDVYFNNLSAYNNGNIAQAFLYWLRSTTGVKDNLIYLRQISEMDSNFVQSISKEKMITLRSVLIHNGISVADYARMFRKKQESSKLHLDQMMDDGILVIKDHRYFLNPLIYSQIVSNFYKLNLLH